MKKWDDIQKESLKEKSKKLQEMTFSVTNIDDAVGTIADCLQFIALRKNLNPTIVSESVVKGIIMGFDMLKTSGKAPEEAIEKRNTIIAKRIMKNLMGFVSGRITSDNF